MTWTVLYHPLLRQDLLRMGQVNARTVVRAIDARLVHGEPDKAGKALAGQLAGCRRIRVGQMRIVYRLDEGRIEVLVVAAGLRRDGEIYESASRRVA